VLLFLPASLLVLLTAELGYESPGILLRTWYTKLRRPGSADEPRRDYYVASDLREAVKELQAVKEQLGSTMAPMIAAAPAHGSSVGGTVSTIAAPVRTIRSAPSGQPEQPEQPEAAAVATRSAAPDLLHELQQAQVGHQQTQQLLLRHIHEAHGAQRAAHGARASAAVAAATAPPPPPPPPHTLPPLPPLLHGAAAAAHAREWDPARSGKPRHKLGRSAISEDLIRAALDDVGLEGILGELSESTRRESSEGKELLRQQRASAALRLHEQLSEEEVLRLAEGALPPETRPLQTGALGGRVAAARHARAPFLAVDEEVDELLEDAVQALPRGNTSGLRDVGEEEAVDADEELAADAAAAAADAAKELEVDRELEEAVQALPRELPFLAVDRVEFMTQEHEHQLRGDRRRRDRHHTHGVTSEELAPRPACIHAGRGARGWLRRHCAGWGGCDAEGICI